MKRTFFYCFSFVLLIAGLFPAGCAGIPRRKIGPTVEKPIRYRNYLTEQGPFVSIPTAVGTIVGIPVMLITAPLYLILEPAGDDGGIQSDACMLFIGPSLTGALIGTPFLMTKRALWDYPASRFADDDPAPDNIPDDDSLPQDK